MGGTINLVGIPDFDQFEIVKEGKVSVTVTAGVTAGHSIAHNLGFVPLVIAAFDDVGVGSIFSDGDIMLPTWTSITPDNVNHVLKIEAMVEAASTITDMYILSSSALAADQGPFIIKYYLIRKRSR